MRNIVLVIVFLLSISLQVNAQWGWHSPSPQGNAINDVAMLSRDTLICVGEFGTILRSTNAGGSWQNQTRINESDLNKIYFIDNKTGWIAGAMGKVMKTTDAGETWFTQSTSTSLTLYDVEFTSIDKGFVVGENGYIAKTTNGGNSWQAITTTQLTLFSLQFIDSLNAWAVGDGISRTTNGGVSWVDVDQQLASYYHSVFFINNDTGWISTNEGKIIKTTNAGVDWEIIVPDSTIWSYLKIQFIDPNNGWLVSFRNILRTSDGGITWITSILPDAISLRALNFVDERNGISVGINGEIYITTDGGINWEKKFKRVPFFSGNCCFFLNTEVGFIGTDDGRILKTTNVGIEWLSIYDNDSVSIWNIYFINDSLGWATGYPSVILRTTNGGNNWIRTYDNFWNNYISSIQFTTDSIGWACNYQQGEVLYSDDGGLSWIQKNLPVNKYFTDVLFTSLDVGYLIGEEGSVLRTSNAGITWVSKNFNTGQYVNDICFADDSTGLAVGFQYIAKTINGGTNWEIINTNFMATSCSILDELKWWVIGENGVMMYTLDGGEHWDLSYQLTNHHLLDMTFIGNNGWIIGYPGLILHTSNSGVTFIEDEENNFVQPKDFLLQQNYPNPFNPNTIISYQLPVTGNVTLKVYDLLGKEVATLVNEEKPSGHYEINFDASNLASGIYYYQLRAGEFVETKKMTLIK